MSDRPEPGRADRLDTPTDGDVRRVSPVRDGRFPRPFPTDFDPF